PFPIASRSRRRAEALVRLFGGRTLLPVLIDAEPPDLRLQCLPRNPEFRGGTRRSGYPPMSLGESRFNHLDFTVCQCRKAALVLRLSARSRGFHGFAS